MSPTSLPNSDQRSLIRYGCVALAATIILLWVSYLVRAPLLMIYVSALFATGLAPLVNKIERQRFLGIGKRRLPRPAAILVIYGTVIGLLAAVGAAARRATGHSRPLGHVRLLRSPAVRRGCPRSDSPARQRSPWRETR